MAFRISEQRFFDDSFSGGFRQYADVDAGVVMGAGFEHGRGRLKLHLDCRANFGFNQVQKIETGVFYSSFLPNPTIETKSRSLSLSILVGLSF